MKQRNGALAFSPSDLNGFLSCPHLTWLAVAVARDELVRPFRVNAHAELIRQKGDEHEARYLAELQAQGRALTEIDFSGRDWERASRETEAAICDEADVIYQAVLREGEWRGLADFVVRTPDGYEVYDTKLARHAKPSHVLQLCFYTEQVARIQRHEPDLMHIVTGLGETESYSPSDFAAYYRRLRARFLRAVEERHDTYPYPVDFCGLCDFLSLCKERWNADDHLTLIAGVSRLQVERLEAAGITTLAALAQTQETKIPSMRRETLAGLKQQARLQLRRRETGEHEIELLPLEDERGFALLPEPSPGDIWLDFEGDPWFDPRHGLEYLTGWIELDHGGAPVYHDLWAKNREEEKAMFERFVDHVVERRAQHPGMHVYHYAQYERTALGRLAGEHATREEALDDILRGEVLVDLFRVTKQALRASVPSYSLKEVEKLYGFERTADVSGGSESVHDFETWLEIGEQSLLDGIRAYNEEDCLATFELHRWLLGLRPGELPWRPPPGQREQSEEAAERIEERDRVRDALLDGAEEGDPRWLLAQLIDYHLRDARPQWWAYYNNLELDDEELLDSAETLGGLEPDGEPVPDKKSLLYPMRFPPQEHKIGPKGADPATRKPYDVAIDNELGTLVLRRGAVSADEPLPRALIPPRPLPTWVQQEAVLRFAKDPERYPALVEILERRAPRVTLDGTLEDAALSLDGSHVFVQGPPGSGKTWNGARMAIELMRAGRRVGITALSHKAIHKFLEDVEGAAIEQGFEFRGLKKCSGDDSAFEGRGLIENVWDNPGMLDPEALLVAGTSFLFAREELDGHVDTLFVDEGGQFALADALAVGTAARNIVVLGDPNQLPQVSQGAHPDGADASVAGHLLGSDETLQTGMGVFLEETWRMRPEVNAFVSESFYEGRLRPAAVTSERSVADGAGVRFLPVDHFGHRVASVEEADAVALEIARLLGTPYREGEIERPLGPDDFIVVAPYNAHVRCLRERIPDTRIQIGTVDKFQGQQATVVFFSMASSSGEDVSRGLEFLFSRNRLNVAVSRAKCLAYVVASPRLLGASCRTVDQMKLLNSLCRFVELAEARS